MGMSRNTCLTKKGPGPFFEPRRRKKGPGPFFAVLCLWMTAAPLAGQSPSTYKAPRTHDGRPNLEGVWNFSSDVPLERPKEFAGRKAATREELAKYKAGQDAQLEAFAKKTVEIFDSAYSDNVTPV